MTKDELLAKAQADLPNIDFERMVKAAARECALRSNLYPRKIGERRMREREAIEELSTMIAIREVLIVIRDAPSVAQEINVRIAHKKYLEYQIKNRS